MKLLNLFHLIGSHRSGDFFITKHSNLPMIHVVFHLIVSDGCK